MQRSSFILRLGFVIIENDVILNVTPMNRPPLCLRQNSLDIQPIDDIQIR